MLDFAVKAARRSEAVDEADAAALRGHGFDDEFREQVGSSDESVVIGGRRVEPEERHPCRLVAPVAQSGASG